MQTINELCIKRYNSFLCEEERSPLTVEKYLSDVRSFAAWLGDRKLTKSVVLEYKSILLGGHAPASVNSYLSSLNSFFNFLGKSDLKVRTVKIQRQIFAKTERELSVKEYERLLDTAKRQKKERLWLIMQTVCSTGIRISELPFVTVQSVKSERAEISLKGKTRTVFIPRGLCRMLERYIEKNGVKSGSVFVTRSGRPCDRSNIWSEMKRLCADAGVDGKKVFPHNLRHLFARTYYAVKKDIVRLADILGHSSINTTRIYTMESGAVHRRQIQDLGLFKCEKLTT